MAIMRAYLDESGIHKGADVCAIAGYFGDQCAWEKLEGEWRAILKEFVVPEFHAKCFWHRDDKGKRIKPYAGWSDQKANEFLGKLLKVITDCSIYPVGAAVIGREWKELPVNERRYLTGGEIRNGKFKTAGSPSKSYFLPFLQAVQRIARYCDEDEKAYCFFGLDKTFRGYALNYYRDIIGRRYPSVHPRNTGRVPRC